MAVAAIEFRPTQPMVEPLALPIYAMIALCFALTGALVFLLGFTIAPDCWPIFWGFPLLALSAMLLRRVGHRGSATALEGLTLAYGGGLAFLLLMFPLSAISAPFADPWLNDLDEAIGFDWVAYTRALSPAYVLLSYVYDTLKWQPLVVVLALCLSREERRMWQLVFASTLVLAISSAIYPLVPAVGAAQFHGFRVANAHVPFGHVIAIIKGGERLITVRLFTGFISVPSYHAASAALLAWGAWPVKPLRWPLIVLNLIMGFATIIFGGHYLVDIAGGLLIAAASIKVAARLYPAPAVGAETLAARDAA